jgi:hypothetical protein
LVAKLAGETKVGANCEKTTAGTIKASISPAHSGSPRKRVHLLKKVVELFVSIFIKTFIESVSENELQPVLLRKYFHRF